MNESKIYRVPPERRLIEFQQTMLPQYLANVTPRKLVMNVMRGNLKQQRVVSIV